MTKVRDRSRRTSTRLLNGLCRSLEWHAGVFKDLVGEFKKRRDYIVKRFNSIPVSPASTRRAPFMSSRISVRTLEEAGDQVMKTADDLANFMLDKHLVAVVAGGGFGAEGYIRLSYATSMEKIQKGLDRIEKALRNYLKKRSYIHANGYEALLGADGKSLLEHKCKTVSSDTLLIPGPTMWIGVTVFRTVPYRCCEAFRPSSIMGVSKARDMFPFCRLIKALNTRPRPLLHQTHLF